MFCSHSVNFFLDLSFSMKLFCFVAYFYTSDNESRALSDFGLESNLDSVKLGLACFFLFFTLFFFGGVGGLGGGGVMFLYESSLQWNALQKQIARS